MPILRGFAKILATKPKFIYLDGEVKQGSIILSNHVGKDAPLTLECYFKHAFRFWGAHEMNGNLKSVYKYQTEIFYHKKKHWNLTVARIACLIISPLTMLFYRGLNLIPTYKDYRLRQTLKESLQTINAGHSVIIFPEDSENGYHDKLTSIWGGFLTLASQLEKQGIDVPIYLSYFNKKKKTYMFDKPILYSQLKQKQFSREQICTMLCEQMNNLNTQIVELTKKAKKEKSSN